MTVLQLLQKCANAAAEGHGDDRVMVDTEGRTFDAHLINTTAASVQDELVEMEDLFIIYLET